jgi:hypothetical protein
VSSLLRDLSRFALVCLLLCVATSAQEPVANSANTVPANQKATDPKSEEKTSLPFQIQLLETRIRFETNGDSRKEVHTIVKINDLAGARQFSRLGFDYNRAFQQVEIPLVKINHANGGTSEILQSAITDAPNPAVQDFPAYHDVRVKSVRILGLQDGDTIEYRVITATTKHPLAPDFWLEHTFDRSSQVLREEYELDLPASRPVQIRISTTTPAEEKQTVGEGDSARTDYRWSLNLNEAGATTSPQSVEPDLAVTSYSSWEALAARLSEGRLRPGEVSDSARKKARALEQESNERNKDKRFEPMYEFVTRNIENVEIPLTAVGFQARPAEETLQSGYGTPLDKFVLLRALVQSSEGRDYAILTGEEAKFSERLPSPDLLTNLIQELQFYPALPPGQACGDCDFFAWLDPTVVVAPLGVIRSSLRGKTGLFLKSGDLFWNEKTWETIPNNLPFPSRQSVSVKASISTTGTLSAKVQYSMRGDNELALRMAFHQAPKERWKDVAGLLALSDGFRGTITNVTASDPMATKDPFTVEYEITQPKFVDWSKKPARIPALLPQIALPDLPGKEAAKIVLGTPLDVQTSLTLKLPEGTTVQTPAGTSVTRDYATFASKYDGHLNAVNVSRHINFLKREIPVDRAPDYNALLRAVQNDQAQLLVLLPAETQQQNQK